MRKGKCKQCGYLITQPRGVILSGKPYSTVHYLCCDKCTANYISRAILSGDLKEEVIARCDKSQGRMVYEYLHGYIHFDLYKADVMNWSTTTHIPSACEVCGEAIQIPMYKHEGQYYWTGTYRRYKEGDTYQGIPLRAVCGEKCFMTKWVYWRMKPFASAYFQLPNGVWLAEEYLLRSGAYAECM